MKRTEVELRDLEDVWYQVQTQNPSTGYWELRATYGDLVRNVVTETAHWCKWWPWWSWISTDKKRYVTRCNRPDIKTRRFALDSARGYFKSASTRIVMVTESDFGDYLHTNDAVVWKDGVWFWEGGAPQERTKR